MIIAELDLHDFDNMTVAQIKQMLDDMPNDAVFGLVLGDYGAENDYLEVRSDQK